MTTTLRAAALCLLIVTIAGCRIPLATDESWEETGPRIYGVNNGPEKRAVLLSFYHSDITPSDLRTRGAFKDFLTRHQASATATVPEFMIDLCSRWLPLQVSRSLAGQKPDYILRGHLRSPSTWQGYMRTWLQFVLACMPGCLLPINPVYFEYDFQLDLYDTDRNLLHTWKVEQKRHYLDWTWGSMEGAQRAHDYGRELLERAMRGVGKSMLGEGFDGSPR